MFLHAATSQLSMFCFQLYAVTMLWWGSDGSSFCHLKNIWRFDVYKCWNAVLSLAWHHHGTIHLVTGPWAHTHVTLSATHANTQKLRMSCTDVTSSEVHRHVKSRHFTLVGVFCIRRCKARWGKGQRVYANLHTNNFESRRVWLGPSCLDGAQKKPWSKMTNESFEDAPSHKPVTTYEHPCELLLHVSPSILSGSKEKQQMNIWLIYCA